MNFEFKNHKKLLGAIQNVRSELYILKMGIMKNGGAPLLNLHTFLHLERIRRFFWKSQISLIRLKYISFQGEDPNMFD